ncbi:hypothetical protein M011DRAFT_394330 [Sporormia fimetaria CBS 119925]|uniref:Uncharacterized protein n=1 Tax=Sporormia fimetaria CBS 119925 TaxID=1340428 RepID=A0A6A6VLZ6_9PLEO|nr:hypothetical protein M011DRAFT_394330 [Sporormia fimetaria CBS 119925]
MLPFRSNSRRLRRSRSLDRTSQSSNPFEWQAQRDQYIMAFPMHPLPSMQAPFEESMLDATGETGYVPFQNPDKNLDTRQQLLCKEHDLAELEWNFTYNCHWRNNPKGKFHPLLKTLAQIVFGVHLLHQHLEKSVADVADILLKHVNELDSFLQRANEDIEASLKDMLFRRKCLKVPMEHVHEFDRLLDDRTYRAQLLDGNVTIERTITRMSILLNDYLLDMSTVRDATQALDIYLSNIRNSWVNADEDVGRIYAAMCGNASGWSQFLQSLVAKAEKLGVVLVQVSSYCNEIEKRCGAASRRSLIASRSSSRSTNSRETARPFRNFAENKPLPMVPNERSPFMTSSSSSIDARSEDGSARKQPAARAHLPIAEHLRGTVQDGHVTRQSSRGQKSDNISAQTSNSDVTLSPGTSQVQPQSHKRSASGQDQQDTDARVDSEPAENVRQRTHVRLVDSSVTEHEPAVSTKPPTKSPKDDLSPPLTGKDSAYSSVSGVSSAPSAGAPASSAALPRAPSAQASHPRAQFGLFPSSPGTPKNSVSGRHGALSPVPPSVRLAEQPAPQSLPRSQSAFDNYTSSSKRLLKKSSLSSLKRLFSKKKHSSADTIAE